MIKFKRYPNRVGEPISWTSRRATLAKNKPERVANKLRKKAPLLADQIEGGEVENFDEEKMRAELQQRADEFDQFWRDRRAEDWRKARKELRACPHEMQTQILDYWNNDRWLPKEGSRLLSVIEQFNGVQAERDRKWEEGRKKSHDDYMAEKNKQLDMFGEIA